MYISGAQPGKGAVKRRETGIMEYRRRKKRRSEKKAGEVLKALILVLLFGAAAYVLFGTGTIQRIRSQYDVSLFESCTGKTPGQKPVPGTPVPIESEPTPSSAPAGESEELELPGIGIYMIQMGFYTDAEECTKAAEELKKLGAAGYIYNDGGKLRLIAAAFSDRASAQSVEKRLLDEGHDCMIFALERSGVGLMITASPEKLDSIRRLFSAASDAVSRLDRLAIEFDAQEKDIEYGISELNRLRSDVRSALLPVEASSKLEPVISLVCDFLSDTADSAEAAASCGSDRIALSAALKSVRIEVAIRYALLLQNIGE